MAYLPSGKADSQAIRGCHVRRNTQKKPTIELLLRPSDVVVRTEATVLTRGKYGDLTIFGANEAKCSPPRIHTLYIRVQ